MEKDISASLDFICAMNVYCNDGEKRTLPVRYSCDSNSVAPMKERMMKLIALCSVLHLRTSLSSSAVCYSVITSALFKKLNQT